MRFIDFYSSPIGKIYITANEDLLLRVDFENATNLPKNIEDIVQNGADLSSNNSVIEKTKQWLDNYFSKKQNTFLPPIKLEDSPFSLLVWNLLLDIPYGKTISYGELAKLVARKKGIEKMSAQAIGHAIGRNPISIIVPCHRVIGADGSLTGYGGGIERKRFLLELEKNTKNFS